MIGMITSCATPFTAMTPALLSTTVCVILVGMIFPVLHCRYWCNPGETVRYRVRVTDPAGNAAPPDWVSAVAPEAAL